MTHGPSGARPAPLARPLDAPPLLGADPAVLIVDDDEDLRAFLAMAVGPVAREVHTAGSGDEALAHIAAQPPDVILLDLRLPGRSGLEICRELKADPDTADIPVIMVTGATGHEHLRGAFAAGADDFIPKPASAIEIQARVRSMGRLKAQMDQLKQTLAVRERLVQMAAHDLRSPLASVTLLASLLREDLQDAGATGVMLEELDDLEAAALQLEGMVGTMLRMARLDHDGVRVHARPTDLAALAAQVVREQRRLAQRRGVTVTVAPPRSPVRHPIDPALMRRVLGNLVGNAVKHSPRGGRVELAVRSVADEPVLEVRDEGPGVPEERRAKIFEPFVTSGGAEGGLPHVGLGLAFCEMVVAAHGGALSVHDNRPRGAIFRIRLPHPGPGYPV